MIIQNMVGGLGNQVMIYVFAQYIKRRNPQQLLLFDDAEFSIYRFHNGFELENVFGVHVNFLSQYFDQDTWEGILSLQKKRPGFPQIIRILHDAGFPIVTLNRPGFYTDFSPGLSISTDQLTSNMWSFPYSNMYCFFNWWLDNYWFEQDREENCRELIFPQLTDYKNLKYAEQINKSRMPVGIHVRRGDFVRLGWDVSPTNYRPACKRMLDEFPDACFFVFSDDPNWCKAHALEMGFDLASRTIYIEGNVKAKSYIDMQLMSMCRGMIRPERSSFSRVAGWLNQNLKCEIELEDPILRRE